MHRTRAFSQLSGFGVVAALAAVCALRPSPAQAHNVADRPPIPELQSPATGSTLTTSQPTFGWTASEDAHGHALTYTIEVGTDINLIHDDEHVRDIQGTTYVYPSPLRDGLWYWHVRAENEHGRRSKYSAPFSLTIDTTGSAAPSPSPTPSPSPPPTPSTPGPAPSSGGGGGGGGEPSGGGEEQASAQRVVRRARARVRGAARRPRVASATTHQPARLLGQLNSLFRRAHRRTPTFAEWQFWARRIVRGDKPTPAALLGAMQWHARLDSSGLQPTVAGASRVR